jgi:hypothetical protein
MRKITAILLALCLFCGCAGNSSEAAATDTDGIDIDFTELTSNLVYAEVYNIMERPDDYMGQTFKLQGPYYAQYDDTTDNIYHFVIIEDALACCQQGMEFKWSGNHFFPNEYPDEMEQIELTGVWESYDENGNTYFYLAVEDVEAV